LPSKEFPFHLPRLLALFCTDHRITDGSKASKAPAHSYRQCTSFCGSLPVSSPLLAVGRSSPISATLISGRLSDPFSDLSAWVSSQHSHLTQAWANESATRSYSLSVHLCSVLHLESLYITVLLSRRSLSASVWSRLHNSWVGKLFSVLRTLQILSSNVY
jgi:hypothetical protein